MRTYGCTTVRAAHPTGSGCCARRHGTGLPLALREWALGAFTTQRREK